VSEAATRRLSASRAGRVVVFGPSPLVEVSITRFGDGATRVAVVAGGQAVWVARMAATMQADVTLCGLAGGRSGRLLEHLLSDDPFDVQLVPTVASTGSFIVDERGEPATEVASDWADPPRPQEVDALLTVVREACDGADVLVVCNPMPGDALPLQAYPALLSWAASRALPVLVDLSSPRLDAALRGGPAAVKLNDWELAELVAAPVSSAAQRRQAVDQLRGLGARNVVVTRGGASAYSIGADGQWREVTPPRVPDGRSAGCGDAMTGALAAALATGVPWHEAVVRGMAAGTAHFSGSGESSRCTVEQLARHVTSQPAPG
jgi:1-phosphofructokinase